MKLSQLGHLMMTVGSIERSCAFSEKVLGMEVVHFEKGRTGLLFGKEKINLQEFGVLGIPVEKGPVKRTGA